MDKQYGKSEKLDELADYINENTTYSDVDCKTGAQILFCATQDLKMNSYIAFEGSDLKCYDYRSVADIAGHTWCMIEKESGMQRVDVQGN